MHYALWKARASECLGERDGLVGVAGIWLDRDWVGFELIRAGLGWVGMKA